MDRGTVGWLLCCGCFVDVLWMCCGRVADVLRMCAANVWVATSLPDLILSML
jgi:hypothetical protein